MSLPGHKVKWLILSLFVLLIPFSSGNQKKQHIKVGVYQLPPLVQHSTSTGYSGFVIDILNYIAKEENWELEYVGCEWGLCLDLIRSHNLDMLCLVADRPERRSFMDFNKEAVYLDWGQIWTHPESNLQSLEDLNGATIAGINEEVFTSEFSALLQEESIDCRFVEVNGYQHLVEMLNERAIDGAVLNRMFNPEFFNIELHKTSIVFAPTPMGFAFPKNAPLNDILSQKLDEYLHRMKAEADSPYQIALQKWIQSAGYDLHWGFILLAIIMLLSLTGFLIYLLRSQQDNISKQAQEIESKSQQLNDMSQKRQEFEKSYNWLFNTINDGLIFFNISIDGIPGKIQEANKQACLIFGRQETRLKEMTLSQLIVSEEQTTLNDIFRELAVKRNILFRISVSTGDQTRRNVEIHANLIDQENQWHVVAVIRDISDRVNTELTYQQRIKNLQSQYEQRNSDLKQMNRELEMFAGTVSHDLQAPLRTLKEALSRIQESFSNGDSKAKSELNRMVDLIDRMNNLIKGILEYNRLTRKDLEMTSVGLSQICSEILLQLDTVVRETGAEIQIERPMPRVIAHPETLVRVVQNLLTNAIKFVEYGTIPKVILRAENRGTHARLWVIDNGIGIAPEYQDRIFDVFQRLHGVEEFPGNGLGLAIVKRALARMNGNMGLISEVGEGSRFWIDLPIDPAEFQGGSFKN